MLKSNKSNKINQLLPKKLKRLNSIEEIVIKLDKSLEPDISAFNQIRNPKINYSLQLKHIIENTFGAHNSVSVLKQIDISQMEIIKIIDSINLKIKNLSIKNTLTRLNKILVECTLTEDLPTTVTQKMYS